MTNTSHKDSTNSYTTTTTTTTSYDESDDLIPPPHSPKYSFEDLPSERDRENDIDDILNSLLAFFAHSYCSFYQTIYYSVSFYSRRFSLSLPILFFLISVSKSPYYPQEHS